MGGEQSVDYFRVYPAGSITGSIDGRGGVDADGLPEVTDTLDYTAFPRSRPVTVNRRTRSGTTVARYENIERAIGGQSASDQLIGANVDAEWRVTDDNLGYIDHAATFRFLSFENLTGGTADDRFVFEQDQTISGSVNGSGGNDTLDVSASETTLTVRIASENAGDIHQGETNDEGRGGMLGAEYVAPALRIVGFSAVET